MKFDESINKSQGVTVDYMDSDVYYNLDNVSDSKDDSQVVNVETSEEETKNSKGTLFSSIVNLMNSCIGGGILAYPYSFLSTGLISGTILGFFLGIFASCTLYIICLAGNQARRDGRKDVHLRSIQDIIGYNLGPFWKKMCEIVLAVYMTGAIVGYMVIIGDSMEPIIGLIFPQWFFLTHRKLIIPLFCTVFIFPFTLLRDITRLQAPSAVANIGIFITAFLIVITSIIGMAEAGKSRISSDILVLNTEVFFHVIPTFFLASPVIALSYQCHVIIAPIRYELKNPSKIRLLVVVIISMSLTIVIYEAIGIFGLLRFGRDTLPDVLLNYSRFDVTAIIGRVLVGICILFTYPVCFFTDRLCIISLFFEYQCFEKLLFKGGKGGGKRMKTIPFIIVTILLFGFTLVLAIIIPDIVVVFGIVGSFGPIFLDYIFPALLLGKMICRSKGIRKEWKICLMIIPCIILVFAIWTMITGLLSNIIRSFVKIRV